MDGEFLVFQLQAPLAAWGEPAVGEYRGSADRPGDAALLGLLGAALGLRRDDAEGCAALQVGCRFAVGVLASGALLRDYHTAQVPGRAELKGRPHATRADELAVPRHDLHTILSTRDYRQGAAWLVAVQAVPGARWPLAALADALRRPVFVPYLGRKCCPTAAPMWPQPITAAHALGAIEAYRAALLARLAETADRRGRPRLEPPAAVQSLSWSDGIEAGIAAQTSAPRKDRVIRRRGWQFGDRTEHRATLAADH